jgi:hypothetical protein
MMKYQHRNIVMTRTKTCKSRYSNSYSHYGDGRHALAIKSLNNTSTYFMEFYSLLCVYMFLSNQFFCFLQPLSDDTFILPEIMPAANSLLKFL